MLTIRKVANGSRNLTVQVSGNLDSELDYEVIELEKGLKLTSLVWVIQEKMGLYLWWSKDVLLLPMESRNSLRLEAGLPAPKDWDGKIYISSFNWMAPSKGFFFVMDFDK